MQAKLTLLKAELASLELAAQHLRFSIARCDGFASWQPPTPEQLERLEFLSARFARLADLLIQRIFRLIDDIEIVGSSTVLDRIYRAEKRGWCVASDLIRIRELRNTIAHEYASEAMAEMYTSIAAFSEILLQAAQQTINGAQAHLK